MEEWGEKFCRFRIFLIPCRENKRNSGDEMKRRTLCQIIVGVVVICGGWMLPVRTYAVASGEFAAWTGVRVNWQVDKRLKFRGTFQARTQHGLKEMERERLNIGLNYRVLPLMQLKGYYELQYRDRGKAGWKIGHRYQAGFVVSSPVRDFKLGWRELFQHTFIGGGKEAQLRSRLQAVYEPTDWRLHPYFSIESFQPVGGEAFFSLPRVRYRPGMRWNLSQRTMLDVYYCRQYDVKRCLNVLGINLEITL